MTVHSILPGFASSEAHVAAELARGTLLLRALLAQHAAELPADADPTRWGLSEVTPREVAAFIEGAPSTEQPLRACPAARPFLEEAARHRAWIDATLAETGVTLRLERLVGRLGLDARSRDALILLALAERDESCRRMIAYLHDNGARPWFSAALLARALPDGDASVLLPGAPLADWRLLREPGGEPGIMPARLRLDWRVERYLAGRDPVPSELSEAMLDPAGWALPEPALDAAVLRQVEAWRRAATLGDAGPLVLEGRDGAGRAALALAAVERHGGRALLLDAGCPAAVQDPVEWLRIACREAVLGEATLVLARADGLLADGATRHAMVALFDRLLFPDTLPVALLVNQGAALATRRPALRLTLREARSDEAAARWRAVLTASGQGENAALQDLGIAVALGPRQMGEALRTAACLAQLDGRAALGRREVERACRDVLAGTLTRFGRRIAPEGEADFDALVLPPRQSAQIAEIRHRMRHGRAVLDRIGGATGTRRGRGFTVLFSGPSGAGKTMAAELLALDHGVELYSVNLAEVVSKWVGETEKHLSALFHEARLLGAALFFDEADALFGKRGEVKEARDRWANLEVNHLLVELEQHDGVVIMATNLRQNMDEAFLRRIHALVEFPMPDARGRLELWRRAFPAGVVPPPDDALRTLSDTLELSGGLIRNIATDAIIAAHRDRGLANGLDAETPIEVSARRVLMSARREFEKLERPMLTSALPARWRAWLDAADGRRRGARG